MCSQSPYFLIDRSKTIKKDLVDFFIVKMSVSVITEAKASATVSAMATRRGKQTKENLYLH